ncbi:uncharacterized protein PV06_10851 [Exophiala oligosperma]|uniref:Uncharacterized protein n=1 Tax=Exophiala oligosperma TaxID=215243 RepID=A0A0D2D3S8_9EURO|nr:uncharacterized protein PV06_10851 [Exophiala oligosperma]KIW36950.1 hypothetical protein PV06_10851 [Exophiala oligosperma]
MSRKRRNTSSPEPGDLPLPKRQASKDVHNVWEDSDEEDEDLEETPYVGEYSGQAGAFPGLGCDDEELFYGPAADGIDYLRMVRSEAKGVPHILTAPTNQLEDPHAIPEEGGYYYDGAYTGVAKASVASQPTYPLAQQYYYDSLLTQFRLVQATMRCTPPLSSIEELASSQFISFPASTRKARAQWEAHMRACNPHPVQVACFDPETVLELVRFLRMKLNHFLFSKDESLTGRIGAWAWAILGKCRDRGELSSDDIGELRALAQRALQILQKTTDGVIEDSCPSETGESHEGELQGAEGMGSSEMDSLTKMTLDMIITVVGEVYGQRDLLDLRTNWNEASGMV